MSLLLTTSSTARASGNALASAPFTRASFLCPAGQGGYRVIAKLWRRYFHPPRDTDNTSWYEKRDRQSKIVSGEALLMPPSLDPDSGADGPVCSRAIALRTYGDACGRRGNSGHVAADAFDCFENCRPDNDRVRTTALSPEIALSYHCLVETRWCGPILGWAARKSAQSSGLVETLGHRHKTLDALRCLPLTAPCIAAPACFQPVPAPHWSGDRAGCGLAALA
jgi:hypothetical protein